MEREKQEFEAASNTGGRKMVFNAVINSVLGIEAG